MLCESLNPFSFLQFWAGSRASSASKSGHSRPPAGCQIAIEPFQPNLHSSVPAVHRRLITASRCAAIQRRQRLETGGRISRSVLTRFTSSAPVSAQSAPRRVVGSSSSDASDSASAAHQLAAPCSLPPSRFLGCTQHQQWVHYPRNTPREIYSPLPLPFFFAPCASSSSYGPR